MRSKAHTALTAPLVLHHTRIYKCALKKSFSMAKCGMNFFWLVKGPMKAARVCKVRNGVKKNPKFLLFSMAKVKCTMNILRSYLNWWHNWQLKNRRRNHTLNGSHSIGDGRIFLKPAATFPFINLYWMSLLSAGSISLDSTFKLGPHTVRNSMRRIWTVHIISKMRPPFP